MTPPPLNPCIPSGGGVKKGIIQQDDLKENDF